MASRKSRQGLPATTRESESEEEVQSSQETDEGVLTAAKDLIANSTIQREKGRKSLEKQRKKRIKELNVRIDASFENRKSRIIKSQQVVWDRLEALNKKRQSLEHQILVSMKTIEAHTNNVASELSAMFEGRTESIFEHAKAQEFKA